MRNYQFRIYPREKHQKKIYQNFDICKDVWNMMLETRSEAWKKDKVSVSKYDTDKLVNKANRKPEWNKVYNHILQNQSKRLQDSFNAFFRRVKNHEKKKGYPKIKKRIFSITYPDVHGVGYELIGNRLWVSKIGMIPIKKHREIEGKIKTLTIKRLRCGEWYATFAVENQENKIDKIDVSKPVGIDVGINRFAFLSDGTQYLNPRHLKHSEKRLKMFQRRVSRKVKGSNNRRKARFKLARFHNYIANQRKDLQHKVSKEIADKYTFIAVEELNIKGLMKNHCLAKAIGDVSWGNFIQKLEYKGSVYKNKPFTPSSCICSLCGLRNAITLKERTFHCVGCGLTIDRDYNASKVILQSSLAQNGYSNYIQLNDTDGQSEIYTSEDYQPLRFSSKKKTASRKDESETEKEDYKKSSSSKKPDDK